MSLTSPKNQYLGNTIHHGMTTPCSYKKTHTLTEARVMGPAYKKRFKADSDVACFLKVADPATKDVSPTTYNSMSSYKNTQVKSLQFNFKGRQKGHIDVAI